MGASVSFVIDDLGINTLRVYVLEDMHDKGFCTGFRYDLALGVGYRISFKELGRRTDELRVEQLRDVWGKTLELLKYGSEYGPT